ncbi:MAG: hemerythrin domain-containing protein [Chloroflexi bacterium]|nr:hemerythrin domain-containing protein [Chloroflexota bacterium]
MAHATQQKPTLHPLMILREEHQRILEFLQHLLTATAKVKASPDPKGDTQLMGELEHVIHHILEAENHHQREEQVLFPALIAKGIEGPPTVMRIEHEELRRHKQALRQIIDSPNGLDVAKLEEHASLLADMLSKHIFKENNILFPMASQAIPDEEWGEIRKGFDRVGYCCFSPTQ